MPTGHYLPAHEAGAPGDHVQTTRTIKCVFEVPRLIAHNTWEIPGEAAESDRRVWDALIVSYGYMEKERWRFVSLRIEDRAVVLDPIRRHTLSVLLADAGSTRYNRDYG